MAEEEDRQSTVSDSTTLDNDQMNNSNSQMNISLDVELRRNSILKLYSKGYNQLEIANALQISQPPVSRDLDTDLASH